MKNRIFLSFAVLLAIVMLIGLSSAISVSQSIVVLKPNSIINMSLLERFCQGNCIITDGNTTKDITFALDENGKKTIFTASHNKLRDYYSITILFPKNEQENANINNSKIYMSIALDLLVDSKVINGLSSDDVLNIKNLTQLYTVVYYKPAQCANLTIYENSTYHPKFDKVKGNWASQSAWCSGFNGYNQDCPQREYYGCAAVENIFVEDSVFNLLPIDLKDTSSQANLENENVDNNLANDVIAQKTTSDNYLIYWIVGAMIVVLIIVLLLKKRKN